MARSDNPEKPAGETTLVRDILDIKKLTPGERIKLIRDALGLRTRDVERLTGFGSNRISSFFKLKRLPVREDLDKLLIAFRAGDLYFNRGIIASDTSKETREALLKRIAHGWQSRTQVGRGRPPKSGGNPKPRGKTSSAKKR